MLCGEKGQFMSCQLSLRPAAAPCECRRTVEGEEWGEERRGPTGEGGWSLA